jgi:hypothetical protein
LTAAVRWTGVLLFRLSMSTEVSELPSPRKRVSP